ncbi:MAG: hypothetical protein AAFQ82_18180 [Myxococcota bacterium]
MSKRVNLRAKIEPSMGRTRHLVGDEEIGEPVWVELQENDNGVILLRLDAAETCIADTWCDAVESAG